MAPAVGLARWVVLGFACASAWLPGAKAELTLKVYNNSAMHGAPTSTGAVADLEHLRVPLSPVVGSVEITGVVALPKDSLYAFACDFGGGQLSFVWLRDHLICHTDPIPNRNTPSSTDGCPEYPIPGKAGDALPIVIHVYNINATEAVALSIKWTLLKVPMAAGSQPPTEAIPASALSPALPSFEVKRRALQNELKQSGWSTWSYNMLGVTRLPDSMVLTTVICQLSSAHCLEATHIEDTRAEIRVGVFAIDMSYWQFYLAYNGLNISLAFSGGTGALSGVIEPLGCETLNCSDYAVVVMPRFAWFRQGTIKTNSHAGSIVLSAMGMPSRTVVLTQPGADLPLPPEISKSSYIAVGLGGGAVGIQEQTHGSQPSIAEIQKVIQEAREREYATYKQYGEFANVKEAVQAATMWNYIYVPTEYGPFLPVSRAWDFVKYPVNLDWAYVIFDWDNIFATLMSSLDAKNIAYSNFIQVIRSRTARGFVPNYSAGGTKSIDRTEPPIGAKVLLQMYRKYNDTWLVELLYEDLLAWNTWFMQERMLGPVGLISLGSSSVDGYHDAAAGTMQGARYESGLDNSPMYDGDMFRPEIKREGSYSIGQMELYDVGFASMFVSEAEALATLAPIAGKASDVPMLKKRAASQRELIRTHLWDSEGEIYTNLRWNNSFYRRISPTSFYSMMSGAPSDEQAATMMTKWLLSPEHFCIAPNGDFAGNHDDCYWGLPSIQRADPAFPPLGYWRGYVWGPMAQLTYWSLQEYDHVDIVRSSRKALCKQMTALMLSQWEGHRHICENYSPHKTADDHHGDCSGTKFYHWGALNGMISLVENGYY